MAKVITTELQHAGASAANITLDSSKNVTCENNLTVDGTTTLTGAVTLPDDTVDIADLSASGTASSSTFLRGDNTWASLTTGKILQVKQTVKTDTASREASGWADIPGMSVNITPASGTKILVHYTIQTSHTNGARFAHTRLVRDSTNIAIGDTDGSRSRATTGVGTPAGNGDYMLQNQTMLYLDTHGANGSTQITYKLQWWIDDNTSQSLIWINRTLADTQNGARQARTLSAITAVEVAA